MHDICLLYILEARWTCLYIRTANVYITRLSICLMLQFRCNVGQFLKAWSIDVPGKQIHISIENKRHDFFLHILNWLRNLANGLACLSTTHDLWVTGDVHLWRPELHFYHNGGIYSLWYPQSFERLWPVFTLPFLRLRKSSKHGERFMLQCLPLRIVTICVSESLII